MKKETLYGVYELALKHDLNDRAANIALTIGTLLITEGNREGAIEKYQKAIELAEDPRARFFSKLALAKDYGFLGRFDEAEQVLDSCEDDRGAIVELTNKLLGDDIKSGEIGPDFVYGGVEMIRGQIRQAKKSVLKAGESAGETY